MAYQVIARKYRPQRFADVVGQEHVTQTLTNAIAQKRIAHAYLFVGPRGTGKTTIARIFAKCLNCTGGPKVDFDDNDPRCIEITEGRSIDVLEIDGASNNGVEQVRELRETVKYMPASGRFKIYVIDEVHMLSTAAFNALLKTLEEPPEHVKFMFATTEPEKVLATILSRCQRFDLRRIPAALIVKHLAHIAKLENVKIGDDALYAIARGADGGMRDAESTLDQLISFCGEKIEESDVLSMFGLTAQGQILKLAHAILAGNAETALTELNDLAKHGKDLARLLSDLLNHFRNLLIYQVSRGDLKLLEVSEVEAASLAEQSAGISTDALTRIMEVLTDCESRLRDAASKKILIEVALLKAMEARSAVSLDSVLKQLQDLRGKNSASVSPAPVAANVSSRTVAAVAPKVERSVVNNPPTHVGGYEAPASTTMSVALEETPGSSAGLSGLWSQVIEAVGRVSPFTRSYLLEAHPVSFAKNVFTIGFDPEFEDHIGLVDNAKNHTLLQTKLDELGHANVQIKFIKAERPAGAGVAPVTQPTAATVAATQSMAKQATTPAARATVEKPTPFNKDEFKNDPLIQKALEIFKGQIVDVRA
ncbi:MAG: DNA polymerase III subunit gamma/tau [Verrucomicrobia bacterium]|nr:DNA polymerase III subunit gamma/tau [Verrucomicrobiota bacterium]